MQKQQSRSIRWPMVIIISLASAVVILWSMSWKGDSYYSGAYQEVVRPEPLPGGLPTSVEPRALGLKEREVRKNAGKGYSVY